MKRFPPPEQRSRTDILVTAGLSVAALALTAGVWLTSQQSVVDHQVAADPLSQSKPAADFSNLEATDLPGSFAQSWTAPTDSTQLIAVEGGTVQVQDTRISMLNAETGEEVWHYDQQREICAVSQPNKWKSVAVTFRGPKGCGEVISFDITNGQYAYTRDALASEQVAGFTGDNRAGTISPERVEIWRSDLVRTVEVGAQEAPHKPDQQEHLECSFTSALVHNELLATAQTCPDPSKKLVRLLKATPENSTIPESRHEFNVPAGAEIVAVGTEQAAVYIPPTAGKPSRMQILNASGEFHTYDVPEIKGFPETATVGVEKQIHQPRTYVSDELQTWFDGQRLTIFNSKDLAKHVRVEGAMGVGAMYGNALLVPVKEGIAVVNPRNGQTERVITVDRGGYAGPVTVGVSNGHIVEQRGTELVGLASV